MVYLISGLGADERVFKFLSLPQIDAKPIFWEKTDKAETISQYCKKLLKQIDLDSEIILIGVSFGGIVAQEIAKLVPVKKIIIVSSVKSPSEFSFPLRFARATQIHRIIPAWIFTL